jgi:WhiB family transcriptional regulator, redox-sensing transcriptional regulator
MIDMARARPQNDTPRVLRAQPSSSVDWRRQAACRDVPVEMFFHPEGERGHARQDRVEAARAVCARCPVRTPCRDFARSADERYGIWGGESEEDRRSLRAAASAPASPNGYWP